MDRKRVAIELLRIARALVSADYPAMMSDRAREAYDFLRQALAEKRVYNARYVDYKDTLTHAFVRMATGKDLTRGVWLLSYYADAMPHEFNGLPKAIRNLEKFLSNSEIPESAKENKRGQDDELKMMEEAFPGPLRQHLEDLKSWLPVGVLLKDLKSFIVKGREPSTTPSNSNRYLAPVPSNEAVGIVFAELDKLAEPLAKRLIEYQSDSVERQVEELVLKIAALMSDGKSRRFPEILRVVVKGDDVLAQMALRVFDTTTLRLNLDYKETILKEVSSEVNQMTEAFKAKNVKKIAPVLTAKGGFKGARILHGGLTGYGFGGEIMFAFTDGTEFTVRNKMVIKWGLGGTFAQFPTTFHDVKFPDGKKRAMLSEEEMNKEWAVAK